MDNIVDLNLERDKRDGPDPECRNTDQFGRKMFLYSLGYQFEGKDWSLEIWAYDLEDAEARMKAIKETLEYIGQVYAILPA